MKGVELGMIQVDPIFDEGMRHLCFQPYALHPKGCPNYGKRKTCPPQARLYTDAYDMIQPIYAVVNEYNLSEHVDRMRDKHPDWSERQLYCVLYWQGSARKQLKYRIMGCLRDPHCYSYQVEVCPEAMGINVTETLYRVGIVLEWPPVLIVRQIALLGKPNYTVRYK